MDVVGGLELEHNGQSEHVRFRLSSDEATVLSEFVKEARRLDEAVTAWGGIPASYNVKFRAGEPLEVSGSELADYRCAALLHLLRPFLLQDERTHFHRVRNIISNAVEGSPLMRDYLKAIKDRFSGALIRRQFVFTVGNDLIVNSEAAFERWLNAHEYHRNRRKAQELVAAHDPLPVDSSRPIFIMLLAEKTDAIRFLGWIASTMLSSPESADYFNGRVP
jgi:hypothetical protein